MGETNLREAWLDFITGVACQPPLAFPNMRASYQGVQWSIPGEVWNSELGVRPTQLGYRQDRTKLGQLRRIYFNQVGLDFVKSKIKQKEKQTIVAAGCHMQASQKESRSAGHCIQSVVMVRFTPVGSKQAHLAFHIHYRSTELTQKFLADLIFLKSEILPYLMDGRPEPLYAVTFHFSCCFFSTLFVPVLFQFTDPVKFLKRIRETNPSLWKQAAVMAKNCLTKGVADYSFRTRKMMIQNFLDGVQAGRIDPDRLRRYLTKEGVL